MNNGLDPTIFAAALVTVIAAVVGGTVQIVNAFAMARDRRDAREERRTALVQTAAAAAVSKENGHKADVLIENTAKIHELTNSTNSNLQKALELMTEKNAGLEKLLAVHEIEKQATASMRLVTDAQAAAALLTPTPGRGAPDVAPVPVAVVNQPLTVTAKG